MTTDRPVLFLLHALGGSRLAFDGVREVMGDSLETVAIDLPGFGDEAAAGAATVEQMCNVVVDAVRARAPARWVICGHSMGGKISTIVASRAMNGEAGLFGLMGVALLAGSPPSPEPMDERRRASMLHWVDAGSIDDQAAQSFIAENTGAPLTRSAHQRAMADLQRCSPAAWRAWLERGSCEDWSTQVGVLPLPALLVVGGEDGDLGEAGQRAANLPVYPRAELLKLDGAGHLLPLERPDAVGAALRHFCQALAAGTPAIPAETHRVIDSDRVSARTRGILARRALPDAHRSPTRTLTPPQLATLRALADCVLPQSDAPKAPVIDLAARLDQQLSAGDGDGWRFADLPPDPEACAMALDALAGFEDWEAGDQDRCVQALIAGRFMAPASGLSPQQMQRWFEDLRSDLVRLWLAHPASAARIGFHGYANGGDGTRPQGFDQLGVGEREPWQPREPAA